MRFLRALRAQLLSTPDGTTHLIEPPINGEVTQERAIAPSVLHCTDSAPRVRKPTPMRPPTSECVVDTGREKYVATASQVKAPIMVASIMCAYRSMPYGPASMKLERSRIPELIVPATSPPARLPRNSQTPAMYTACCTVMALEPTDVPSALLTSCAPIAQAMANAISPASAIILRSMVGFSCFVLNPLGPDECRRSALSRALHSVRAMMLSGVDQSARILRSRHHRHWLACLRSRPAPACRWFAKRDGLAVLESSRSSPYQLLRGQRGGELKSQRSPHLPPPHPPSLIPPSDPSLPPSPTSDDRRPTTAKPEPLVCFRDSLSLPRASASLRPHPQYHTATAESEGRANPCASIIFKSQPAIDLV